MLNKPHISQRLEVCLCVGGAGPPKIPKGKGREIKAPPGRGGRSMKGFPGRGRGAPPEAGAGGEGSQKMRE
jgi:hypothetical protein